MELHDTYPEFEHAYKLLHDGTLALSKAESRGIRMDIDALVDEEQVLIEKIEKIKSSLVDDKIYRAWRNKYGAQMNMMSRDQLGTIVFDVLKLGDKSFTASNKIKSDEKALLTVDNPFIHQYLKISKLEKALNTYIRGILRECVNGRLHPSFNLAQVVSYRSSSSNPNFQNMPVRNPEVAKYIRTKFLPDKGCFFSETDYSGIEVSMAACYHQDPTMLEYLTDETKDMHGDMGSQLYAVDKKNMDKDVFKKIIRYGAKNKFVFPVFYGSFWRQCATNLWLWAMENRDKIINTEKNLTFGDHLKETFPKGCGVPEDQDAEPARRTFAYHVREVENHFWNVRFPKYAKWKKDTFAEYLENGFLISKTGFRYVGVHKKTEILNLPIQGSAFHCLLWSFTRITQRLEEEGFDSFLCGQIHDSIVANVRVKEARKFLRLANEVMTQELLEKFPWICVPFKIEVEMSPPSKTWNDKSQVQLTQDNKLLWKNNTYSTGMSLADAMTSNSK